MAAITVTISDSNSTIAQLNDKLNLSSGSEAHNLLNLIGDYVARTSGGGVSAATVQVTTRDTAPSVSTSGAGSLQVSVTIG